MDFVQQFNNIEGRNVGEIKRNFNKFLLDISNASAVIIADTIKQLSPKNHQEELLHLQLLLEHGTYEELLVILFKGNKILNKNLTSSLRFINQLAQITPLDFVDDICPEISFVTRRRIINRLPRVIKNDDTAEAFFDAIKDRYGFKSAQPLITVCSEQFIHTIITDYQIKLNDRQLITIHNKFPKLTPHYFEQHRDFSEHAKFACHLALHDVSAFFALSKHGLPIISRKSMVSIMKTHKAEILQDPDKYRTIITPRIANSCFNFDELVRFFVLLLPENLENFSWIYPMYNYLKAMPRRSRYGVFSKAFESYYNVPYTEDYLNCYLLELMALEDRRRFNFEEKYVEFCPTHVSLQLIKDRIRLTSETQARKELILNLLLTCKYNNDSGALLEVLRYFLNHHKNDLQIIRDEFLETLYSYDNFNLPQLSQEHWNCINDILKLSEINKSHLCYFEEIIEKRIHFKYLNGLDFAEDIPQYMKYKGAYCEWRVDKSPPEVTRAYLLKTADCIESVFEETEDRMYASAAFFTTVLKYNKMKKAQTIPIFKYANLIDFIFDDLKDSRGRITLCLTGILKTSPQNKKEIILRNKMIERYFDICPEEDAREFTTWLLHNEPELILAKAELFLDEAKFSLGHNFYYKVSKIAALSEKFREIAMNIISSKASRVMAALKYLSFEDGFVNVVQKFRPKEDCKIDIYEEGIQDQIQLRRIVIQGLARVKISTESIAEILRYCKGDYLVHAIKALYASMYHMPEKLLQAPIEVLMQGRFAVKEHAIYLTANLCSSTQIRSMLTILGNNQKDHSLGKFILKRVFNAFKNYPDDEYFALLIKHFEWIDKNDEESFKMVLEVSNIPKKYQAACTEFVWGHPKMQKLRFDMLNSIEMELWNALPRDLCTKIIADVLSSNSTHSMDGLIYEYLLNNGDIANICTKIDDKIAFKVCEDLVHKIINDKARREQGLVLVSKLIDALPEIPLSKNKHCLEILFEACKRWMEIEGDLVAPLAQFMAELQLEQVSKYGPDIAPYLRDFCCDFLSKAIESIKMKYRSKENASEEFMLDAAECLSKNDASTHTKLLALHVVPKKKTKDVEFVKRRKRIIDDILVGCDPIVDIYFAKMYYKENI